MSTARKPRLIAVEDYLAGELVSPIKHEYVDGVVYAMAGARSAHNIIAVNTISALHTHLRGRACRPFNSDTKIHIRHANHVRFYYPDVSVVCRFNPQSDFFQDEPVAILEVLSQSTHRIDECEKRDAYLTIPSLGVYVMIEQDSPSIVVMRRNESGFVRELHEGLDAVLPLAEIGIDLPLAEIYESVELSPEPVED